MWKFCCCCFCDKLCRPECWEYKMIDVDGVEEFPLLLPDTVWENILSYLTFAQLAKLRLVNQQFNRVCQTLLTIGSVRLLRRVEYIAKVLDTMKKESDIDENYHDAVKCLKYNLHRLCDTYGRFMMERRCGFIAGLILDRCNKILFIVTQSSGPCFKVETKLTFQLLEMCNCAVDHFNESTIFYLQRPELDLPDHLQPDNRKMVIDMHRIIRDQDDLIYYRQAMVKYLEKVVSNFKASLSSLSTQFTKQRRREITDRLVVNKKAYNVKRSVIPSSTPILDLPSKVLVRIFSNLSYDKVARIRPVCRMFNLVCQIVLNGAYYTLNRRLDKIRKERYLQTNVSTINHYRRKPFRVRPPTPPIIDSSATPDSSPCSTRSSSKKSQGSQDFGILHPEFIPILDETTTFVTDLYYCYLNGMYDHRFCFVAGLVLDKYSRWVEQVRRMTTKIPSSHIQEHSMKANRQYRGKNPDLFTLFNHYFDALFTLSKEAKLRLWRTQKIDMFWYTKSIEMKRTRRWIEEKDEEIDELDLKIRGFYESICISNQNVIFLQIMMLEEERRRMRMNATLIPAPHP